MDPFLGEQGRWNGWLVGGINNSDLTGIMCRLGSLIIVIGSGSIDIISHCYVNTL